MSIPLPGSGLGRLLPLDHRVIAGVHEVVGRLVRSTPPSTFIARKNTVSKTATRRLRRRAASPMQTRCRCRGPA
jgi:hypothetical protein